ncbi:hypothetical protein [Paraburkholderia caffeinilytica]|uniref:hypothetical protein n=1 Tax=Paraburkholderia caffeinilytica TaxID=1761016 RepID=UPI0038B9D705
MQITDSLNLALPVGDGMTAYHTPISRQVYEMHYSVINAVKAALSRKGIHYQMGSGPRIANLVLKDEGEKDAAERESFDAKGAVIDDRTPVLLAEIRRLTMLLAPGANGYELIPVDAAISQGKIDEEDWSELEAALVFFTCHAMTARKANRLNIAAATASVLSGSITALSPTAFAASLQTSMKVEPTPKTASSLPV